MPRPHDVPIGLLVARVAKLVARAFDDALAAAGGTRPTWQILLSLTSGTARSQRELADALGVREPTITHHLAAMESAGLVTRRLDPASRRQHVVVLTDDGVAAFHRLRSAAAHFDSTLRQDFTAEEMALLRDLLQRLAANATGG